MNWHIQELLPHHTDHLDLVTDRCMETVLETVPEFEGLHEKVLAAFPNFTFVQMRKMIGDSLEKPNHRILAVFDQDQQMLGHSIISVKTNDHHQKFGYCFSRYILPNYRRQGMGRQLLSAGEKWFIQEEAAYIRAETHKENQPLQKLFLSLGFYIADRREKHYPYLVLIKELLEKPKEI